MITVDDFKQYFKRDFPYLPYYIEGKAYFLGDEVYNGVNFYQSLIDSNLLPLNNTTGWKLINSSEDEYIQDEDIEKAIDEAELNFNKDLFDGCPDRRIALLYLTAFYLVIDIKNGMAGISSNGYAAFTASKSVGNVSESYGLPQSIVSNPNYALYLDNGYGKKYLTYIVPRTSGFFYVSRGGTTIG